MSDRISIADLSSVPKWRTFEPEMTPGTAIRTGAGMGWSVSPGEATFIGERPEGEVVELTHVRAMFRITGDKSRDLINRVCGLDLTDSAFPAGAAARTLLAGVATEVVRDDHEGTRSYLLLPSRSFSKYIRDVLSDASYEWNG